MLTLLVSCTAPVTPEKQMTPDTMIKEEKMKADEMKKEVMMSGSDTMMKEEKNMEMDSMKKEEILKTESMAKPEDTMMAKEGEKMMEFTGYMNYDEAKVKEALSNGQKVVLFFHAAWCPTCRSLDSAISAGLVSIPADTLIVKVDYDTSDSLKKKYRVVTQHTTVVLNSDGTEKSKKIGARSVSEVLN